MQMMAYPLWRNQEACSIALKPTFNFVGCPVIKRSLPYFTPKHHQKMFGLNLQFTKKNCWRLGLRHRPYWDRRAYDASQDPLVGSSLSAPLPRGIQRYPWQRKMRHRNPRGRQNMEVRGQSLNLVS